ncbi:4-hydroxy-tetrahydrodipicolinate synthase [Peptostreptococcus faecalis]|uniref:4-hydroxy-tetrahydrodipicolinate synthase n=1 Tax=Peptostreptococcus faecalis TaxID=2045015 RepID=UPI000C7DECAA|nr:4-hydroxy-tetrahydrodipicolinate synthase [Peptostreptococcus faecalis]
MIFKGMGINIVTPFLDTNEIDFDSLKSMLDKYIDTGVNAIILGRLTGEFSTLNNEEIESLIDFVVKYVNKKAPVIVQTGFNDTRRSIELSIKAKRLGADALILPVPYYNVGNEQGIKTHFKSIAISSGLPCYIENDASNTQLNLSPDLVSEIAQINNIVGLIESSSDLTHLMNLIAMIPDGFQLVSSDDMMIFTYLTLGASAFISSVANISPKETVEIYNNYEKGDILGARNQQLSLIDLINALKLESHPIPLKTALNMLGYNAGEFRLPLHTMNVDKAAQLAALIMDMDIKKL